MKKIVRILCAVSLIAGILLFTGIAFAGSNASGVNISFSSATDEELREAIELIQAELDARAKTKGNAETENTEPENEIGVTKTNSDGISFTVLSMKESKGSSWYKPGDGNVFVVLEIEIVNNSKSQISINSIYGFEAICDDYVVDYSFAADCAVDNGITTTDLKPGRKIKGYKAFEVPKSWKELMVGFTPDFSVMGSGEEIEVFICK